MTGQEERVHNKKGMRKAEMNGGNLAGERRKENWRMWRMRDGKM